jgi:hypothetical protein
VSWADGKGDGCSRCYSDCDSSSIRSIAVFWANLISYALLALGVLTDLGVVLYIHGGI